MSVQLTCPFCKLALPLQQAQPGIRLTCPKCNFEWTPRAGDFQPNTNTPKPPPLPPPLPPTRRPEPLPLPESSESPEPLPLDDHPPNRRTLLYAGAGVGALACVGGIGWLVWGRESTEEEKPQAKTQALSGEEVFRRLIRCSTMVVTARSLGSGMVVDAKKRLVVTNCHVVRQEQHVAIVFPLYDSKGDLITDFRQYQPRIKEVAIPGEVIAREVKKDLALVRVERLPDRTAAVALATHHASPGSVVYSLGNSGTDENLLWRLTKGNVRGRVQQTFVLSIGQVDAMILETDAPTNPGDSGGPVVNDRGELVAVVDAGHLKQRAVSQNIDIEEVRKFIAPHVSAP